MSVASRTRRVEAALGRRPLDLLIQEIRLVNVFTGEIYPAEIGICEGHIVHAGGEPWAGPEPVARLYGGGKWAVPGLIDSHMHIESSMMSPDQFAAAVLPRGTTTVVADPHEIGNVLGLDGVRYMLESTRELPLRVYIQAPSCVPAVPGQEVAGADFGPAEVAEMLDWDGVTGLAEVMDYVGVIEQSDRMRDILGVALSKDTVISGHCPELLGQQLDAYMVAGPASDHETFSRTGLLERLRSGMTVEARVSSFSENVSTLSEALRGLGSLPPNLVFCTDDIWPDDLLHRGHMDRVVRTAITRGMAPVDAVRAATLQGAQRHRLQHLGAIAPGRWADLLLVSDLEEFSVDEVFVGGRLVARGGELGATLAARPHPLESANTVHPKRAPQLSDFRLPAREGAQRQAVRVMTFEPDRTRGLSTVELPVVEGIVDLSQAVDLCLVSIHERHGRTDNHSLSLVRGLGLREGAVASTVAHDSHNLLVAGRDPADMLLAAEELIGCGGGMCCVKDGQVLSMLPLPIAGLMSPLPLAKLVPAMEDLNRCLTLLGLPADRPLWAILGLALPVIPHYGLTDRGLVDVDRQVILPVWADEE